jgi:hypothetical protein
LSSINASDVVSLLCTTFNLHQDQKDDRIGGGTHSPKPFSPLCAMVIVLLIYPVVDAPPFYMRAIENNLQWMEQ